MKDLRATARDLLIAATAPVIYLLILPAALLDLFTTLYQSICFPIYGLARVQRADFMRLDRHKLPGLSAIQKLNCDYCGYFNGVLAYTQEVASCTEEYWCPIRHKSDPRRTHRRYRDFAAFDEKQNYQRILQRRGEIIDITPSHPAPARLV